ncbi:MAG: protease modulator HflC [Proteobacteria bacterium]|nr:protease modulator HflC [Pseudomonadota bacterium]
MTAHRMFLIVILLFAAFLFGSTVYVIYEGQQGLLLRLGKIMLDPETGTPAVKNPGIHFKIPLINTARIFDTRIQTLDIESSRIVTAEKKDVLVDYYVKWRITDLPLYFTRAGGNEFQAETLLKQKVNDGLRAEFGKRNIKEVVSGERSDIMSTLRKQADSGAKDLGIDVVDVRIKRIDLPPTVSNAIYDRMRAERERVATEHRAEGKSAAEAVRANADANVTVTLANAMSTSKQIRGEGDATASKIYAEAYSKDPSFYSFYRSLQVYKEVFKNKNDILVLKPDSQFFKYFNNTKGSEAESK